MIKKAAIFKDGKVWTGRRHSDIIHKMIQERRKKMQRKNYRAASMTIIVEKNEVSGVQQDLLSMAETYSHLQFLSIGDIRKITPEEWKLFKDNL